MDYFKENGLYFIKTDGFYARYQEQVLLLEDGEVLDALNQDVTFFSAAAQLRVPMEMLDFKFRLLKWKGYKMLESPIQVNSNFMRNMEVPDDADYYS